MLIDYTAPDISHFYPMVSPEVHPKDNKLYYYCDFITWRADLLYRVDWYLTSGLDLGKHLHKSINVKYVEENTIRDATKLTEEVLVENGITNFGFTVS